MYTEYDYLNKINYRVVTISEFNYSIFTSYANLNKLIIILKPYENIDWVYILISNLYLFFFSENRSAVFGSSENDIRRSIYGKHRNNI